MTAAEGQGRHRPKPGRTKADGRFRRGRGTGRNRTVGQQLDVPNAVEGTTEIGPEAAKERSGATGGTAEAGPGVADRRPRSCVRSKPDGGPGSPCLDADGVGEHQPPTGQVRPFSPEGEAGRCRLADASHDGPPVGGPAAQGPRRYPNPAEAGIGWSRRTLHGNGRSRPRGAVRAQSPKDREELPRVLVRVTRSNNPVRGRVQCEAETRHTPFTSRVGVGPERERTQGTPKHS